MDLEVVDNYTNVIHSISYITLTYIFSLRLVINFGL